MRWFLWCWDSVVVRKAEKMVGKTKKQRQVAVATIARHATYSSTGPRSLPEYIDPPRPIDAPPKSPKRVSQFPEKLVLENLHPLKKRRKGQKNIDIHQEVGRTIFRSDIQLLTLARGPLERIELKWSAVLEYFCVAKSAPSSLQSQRTEEVASKYSISRRTLENWAEKAMTGSLCPKPRKERQKVKVVQGNLCLREVYDKYGGEFSQAALTELMEQHTMKVSKHTVQRILATPAWGSARVRILPINSPHHQENRKIFCKANLDHQFGGEKSNLLWIDVDEKHFYAFNSSQIMYLPRELMGIANVFKAASKKQTGSVMFFGAVAKSRKSDLFDGRILLKPVVKECEQKRRSAYGKKGDIISVPITMNKKLFIEYCKCHLIPAIRNVLSRLNGITRVVAQIDNAGAHGGGRGDIQNTLKLLCHFGRQASPHITFIAQPSRSPDFNALDLGAWFSLSCGVKAVRSQAVAAGQPKKRLVDNIMTQVIHRWNSWDAMTQLHNIFETKHRIMHASYAMNGSNEYLIPRSGQSHTDPASRGPNHMVYPCFGDSASTSSSESPVSGENENEEETNNDHPEGNIEVIEENEVVNGQNEIEDGEDEIEERQNEIEDSEDEMEERQNEIEDDEDEENAQYDDCVGDREGDDCEDDVLLGPLKSLKYQEEKEWDQCENSNDLRKELIAYGEDELMIQSIVNDDDLLVSKFDNLTMCGISP